MDANLRAWLLRARVSLTASLPWMPPPDERSRVEVTSGTTTTTTTSRPPAYVSTVEEAEALRQAVEDELMARAEQMLAQPVPQDQPWAQIGLTIALVLLLLGGDDEGAPGVAGWLPRWRRRRGEGDSLKPSARELAEALRGHISTYATALFNARQAAAIEAAAARDPRIRLVWVSRHDGRVRVSHRAADGQVRAVGSLFRVGAAMLPYPGWPGGPPEEVWRCRCVLLPARL